MHVSFGWETVLVPLDKLSSVRVSMEGQLGNSLSSP